MHTHHLNEPRYVFDGKPPDMKSGEVTHTCNTFFTNTVVGALVCSACGFIYIHVFSSLCSDYRGLAYLVV